MDTTEPASNTPALEDRLTGLLLGTAVGDALGLPAEGLGRLTIATLGWTRWRHRLLFRRGMLSDDTEHTLFVAQSLLAANGDPDVFERRLAWELRLWLLGLPAGIGLATGRAILKLWLGFPPRCSGVRSAGNGPAMRSAIIGAVFRNDRTCLQAMVKRCTRITHTDARASTGALAIAQAAAFAMAGRADEHIPELLAELSAIGGGDNEWAAALQAIEYSLSAGASVTDFCRVLGLGEGVSGYIYHTVPVALYAWLRHYGSYRTTLAAALDCGGDTDTVGAITGALAGATAGAGGIPSAWLHGIIDWPRSVPLLRRVSKQLSRWKQGEACGPVGYFWPAVLPRNLLFLCVVLVHGLLRLLPVSLRRHLS